jgi:hypothetical protein
MTNVVSIYADKRIHNLYEVVDSDGIALWGGNNLDETIQWLRMPEADRVLVSAWSTTDDDAVLIGEAIDITSFFKAIIREYGDK